VVTACLHHIFTKSVEGDIMEQPPFDKSRSLLLEENNKRVRYLSEEEIQKLLEKCPGYLRDIVECARHTGMRRGEILSLT
jgi:integrase